MIIAWIKSLWHKPIKVADNPVYKPTTVQQDVREYETIKRVRKSFEQQQEVIDARSLKSHDPTCTDPFLCTKEVCFIREPDKIVSSSKLTDDEKKRYNTIRKRNMKRLKNISK